MIKNNKWRLVSDVLAIFPIENPDVVFITNLDNKKQESIIANDIENCYQSTNYTKQTVNNEFHIKITSSGLFVRCDNFIDSSKWYWVNNFQTPLIYWIISQVKNNLGVFDENETFEAIFNDEFTSSVGFTNKSMFIYNSCFEEMGRRVVCDMSKKTKKRIPGHRYDSIDKSLYYLGSFMSRNNNGKFADDLNMVPIDLYATNITKDDKSISDIFKNHIIGKDIIALDTQESLVDFGEILKNDFVGKDIQNYWNYLYTNSKNDAGLIEEGYKTDNYGRVLQIFSYQSANNLTYNLPPEIDLTEYIKGILLNLIKIYWNKNNKFRKENEIKDTNNKGQNIAGLINLFYANLIDSNIYKNTYYSEMLSKKLNISVCKLAEETLDNWEKIKKDAEKVWDSYIELAPNIGLSFTSDQRTKEVMKIDVKKTPISDLLSETLKNVIIEIAYEANDNFGLNINNYKITNLGTKRTPREFVEMDITVEDICNSGKLNDELKEVIMKDKFNNIKILCNKGGKLE